MDDRLKSRSSSLKGRARFLRASFEDKKPSNPCAVSAPNSDLMRGVAATHRRMQQQQGLWRRRYSAHPQD